MTGSADGKGGRAQLPMFLKKCVVKGLIDTKTAHLIEELRKESGLGLTSALEKVRASSRLGQGLAGEGLRAAMVDYAPLLLDAEPDPEMTFDTFVPFEANAFTLEVARAVAAREESRRAYNPLYVYASIGLGKTHLLSAIANELSEGMALMVNTADLEVEYERASRMQCRVEFRQWLVKPDVLLVDDIQLCEDNADLQRELFAVLNHRIRTGRSVCIASDVPPTRLEGVESRLLSRLGGGVIVGLNMAAEAERILILDKLLGAHGVSRVVLEYLAENIQDSVRHLKAAAKQLVAMRERSGVEITVDLARAVVPRPEDLHQGTGQPGTAPPPPAAPGARPPDGANPMASKFKAMLQGAETEEEQILALEIALGERVRQLKQVGRDKGQIALLQKALDHLRSGDIEEAMACIH